MIKNAMHVNAASNINKKIKFFDMLATPSGTVRGGKSKH